MTPQPPTAPAHAGAPEKTSRLAIGSLGLGCLGLVIPCIAPLAGLILGIAALLTMKSKRLAGRGLAIAGIIVSLGVGILPVLLAAMAIPSFIRFKASAIQAECKSNLKALYTAERAYFLEKDTYSNDVTLIGFQPEARRRYGYFLSGFGPFASGQEDPTERGYHGYMPDGRPGEPVPHVSVQDVPADVRERLGVKGQCPGDCQFTAACVGQTDDDATPDVWAISSEEMVDLDGKRVPPGEPVSIVNDVRK